MALAPRATTKPEPYVVPPSQEFDGNDGAWSTFKLSVGTPGQDFRVLASTKAGEVYVVVPEGCFPEDGADCPNRRGIEPFQSANSPGFQLNVSSTWSNIGQYSLDLEPNLNYTGQGIYGYDKVALGAAADNSAISVDKPVVAGIAEMGYYLGYLPLGIQASSFSSLSQPIDSLMIQLFNQSKIPSLSYSYTAGANYRLKSVFGSLILGGYDSTRFEPNENDFSFSFAQEADQILTVGIQSINAVNTLQGTFSLALSGHFSMIDSSVPHLWLPRAVCDNFETAFGLTYDPATDLYLVNSTIHEQLVSRNPSVTFKLANSLSETGTNYTNIVLPYAAFDLQASSPIYPNATNYFPIRRAANDSQYVLGRTLLQEAYIIVDYHQSNFSLFQAAFPDPLPSPNIIGIESPSNSTDEGSSSSSNNPLSIGAIAGIAAGGAAIIIILIAGAIYLHKRRKTRKQNYELANTQISEANAGNIAAAHKPPVIPHDPQELGGTPLSEVASPNDQYALGRKPYLSPQQEPQELPTPLSPGWNASGVYYEMEGTSAATSRTPSQTRDQDARYHGARPPNQEGRYTDTVSTLSPTGDARFQHTRTLSQEERYHDTVFPDQDPRYHGTQISSPEGTFQHTRTVSQEERYHDSLEPSHDGRYQSAQGYS